MNPSPSSVISKTGSFTIKIRIRVAEMSDSMRDDAVKQGSIAYQADKTEDQIAKELKEFFDSKYYPFWQCVVGVKFGNSITHVSNCYILFSLNKLTFALFKTANGRPWDFDDPVNRNRWRNKCTMFVSKIKVKKSVTSESHSTEEIEGVESKTPLKSGGTEDLTSEEREMLEIDPSDSGQFDGELMII